MLVLTVILSSSLTLHVCWDRGQGGWVEGDCIVSERRGQIRRVQGLDVWHTHSGLVGQHSERKQTDLLKMLSLQKTANLFLKRLAHVGLSVVLAHPFACISSFLEM